MKRGVLVVRWAVILVYLASGFIRQCMRAVHTVCMTHSYTPVAILKIAQEVNRIKCWASHFAQRNLSKWVLDFLSTQSRVINKREWTPIFSVGL